MNNEKYNKPSLRKRIVNLLVHILLAVLAFIWLLPIFWIVLTSFRAEPGAYTNTFLPQGYTLNNYIKLFTDRNVLNFPKMFMNTLIIAIVCCIISTFFVLSVAYSLSRMRFAFRRPYMNIAMILGLFPGFNKPEQSADSGALISDEAFSRFEALLLSGKTTLCLAAAFAVICVLFFLVMWRSHERREP